MSTYITLWAYRWTTARGYQWKAERTCSGENAADWLALYQRDEPEVHFRLAVNKPRAPRA